MLLASLSNCDKVITGRSLLISRVTAYKPKLQGLQLQLQTFQESFLLTLVLVYSAGCSIIITIILLTHYIQIKTPIASSHLPTAFSTFPNMRAMIVDDNVITLKGMLKSGSGMEISNRLE